ncbi:hypothetical protein Q9891_003235, partial [Vibrio cholerae]|nr:hypothetical protein [Vibrio cholerae]
MKLQLDLANCYGINQLSKELDFTKSATNDGINSLYAPNGTLKTSLAKTFKDVEKNKDTKDLIFPSRTTVRNIKIDGADIASPQVMVIDSYNESYSSQQLSTLLVNEELKQQYDTALKEVDGKRSALINGIAKKSGKRDVPSLFNEAYGIPQKELLGLLVTLFEQTNPNYTQYGEYKYDTLFNQKALQLIATEDLSRDLADYV